MLDDIEAVVGAVRAGSAARAILKVILECGSLGEANTAVRQQRIAEGCVLSVRTLNDGALLRRGVSAARTAHHRSFRTRCRAHAARRLSVLVFIL